MRTNYAYQFAEMAPGGDVVFTNWGGVPTFGIVDGVSTTADPLGAGVAYDDPFIKNW